MDPLLDPGPLLFLGGVIVKLRRLVEPPSLGPLVTRGRFRAGQVNYSRVQLRFHRCLTWYKPRSSRVDAGKRDWPLFRPDNTADV